jgi:phage shock protein PspC (stress-responsive transcriptional regulator)
MQKSTSITIGGRRFYLEEDAYAILHDYLESLRVYFVAHQGFDEIIGDIESRIAERFAELQPTGNEPAIPATQVAELIDTIGKPDDIGEGNEASGLGSGSYPRRLFRDLDKGLLAGVCAGLGSYLRKDPNIIRVLFLLAALLYGIGIIVYVVFWLVIPAARTSIERLSMRGAPVTLASIAGLFSLRKRSPEEREGMDRMIAAPFNVARRGATAVAGATQSFAGVLFPILKRIVAFVLIGGATLLLFLVTFALVMALVWFPASYFDPTVTEFIDGSPRVALALSGALTLMIPAIFILAVGVSMLRKRSVLHPPVGFGLIAVWFAALIAAGVLGIRTGMQWQSFEENHPAYQRVTTTFAPPLLTSVDASGTGAAVILAEGPGPAVTFVGRRKDVDRLTYSQDSGALRITTRPDSQRCVVCDEGTVTVTVTVPAADSIRFLSAFRRAPGTPQQVPATRWQIGFPQPAAQVFTASVDAIRGLGFDLAESNAPLGRFRTLPRATVRLPGDSAIVLAFPDSVRVDVRVQRFGNASRVNLDVISLNGRSSQSADGSDRPRARLATAIEQRIREQLSPR